MTPKVMKWNVFIRWLRKAIKINDKNAKKSNSDFREDGKLFSEVGKKVSQFSSRHHWTRFSIFISNARISLSNGPWFVAQFASSNLIFSLTRTALWNQSRASWGHWFFSQNFSGFKRLFSSLKSITWLVSLLSLFANSSKLIDSYFKTCLYPPGVKMWLKHAYHVHHLRRAFCLIF